MTRFTIMVCATAWLVVSCGGGGDGDRGGLSDDSPLGMTLEEYVMRARPAGETHDGIFTAPDAAEVAAERDFDLAEINAYPIDELRCYFRVHSEQGAFLDLFQETAYAYFDDGAPLSGGFELRPASYIGNPNSSGTNGVTFELRGTDGEVIEGTRFELYNDPGPRDTEVVVGQTWFTPTSRVARIEQLHPCPSLDE